MDGDPSALQADWLGACRRSTERLRAMLAAAPSTAERVLETGSVGSGASSWCELETIHCTGLLICERITSGA